MIDKRTLQSHLAYTTWATHLLLNAVSEIPVEHLTHDFKTADRHILGSLAHVFAADRVWLDRVQGRKRETFVQERDRDLSVLREEWPALLSAWRGWVEESSEDRLNQPVAYSNFEGQAFETPPGQIILHVVNHGTHHRGQVSGFLRALGHKPPQLDLIRFYRGL